MNICLPVLENADMASPLSPHFGQAPGHLVINDEGTTVHYADNNGCEHTHGACTPVDLLANYEIKAVICQGLGRGAFFRLRGLGVDVFQTDCDTVGEALEAYKNQSLHAMAEDALCNHGHDHDH